MRRRSSEKREEEEEKDGNERLRKRRDVWWEDVLVRRREKPYGRQKCQVRRSTFFFLRNLFFSLLSNFSCFLKFPALIRMQKNGEEEHSNC